MCPFVISTIALAIACLLLLWAIVISMRKNSKLRNELQKFYDDAINRQKDFVPGFYGISETLKPKDLHNSEAAKRMFGECVLRTIPGFIFEHAFRVWMGESIEDFKEHSIQKNELGIICWQYAAYTLTLTEIDNYSLFIKYPNHGK